VVIEKLKINQRTQKWNLDHSTN